MSKLALLALASILFIQSGVSGCTSENSSSSGSTSYSSNLIQIDKSSEAQTKRKQLIDNLIAQGVFAKVEMPGTRPYIWVTPSFYALEYDAKTSFTRLVWSYYFGPNDRYEGVTLRDNITGKNVGTFDMVSGLKLK
jgi:hypothetical protein